MLDAALHQTPRVVQRQWRSRPGALVLCVLSRIDTHPVSRIAELLPINLKPLAPALPQA